MFEDGLAELHTHLGASVASDILWSLAHEQGIALPVKDYWEFDRLVTIADPRRVDSLDALDQIYHWTELIQSSPVAVERSVHGAIGGAYRSQGITTLELRFNPMKRNRGGERDLDHIIMAATRGLDRASLEYPQVRAGLILMMDRTFDERQNAIIVEKAIRYASRGIVGVDIAGPRPRGERYPYRELQPLIEEARSAGLGITIHVGEEGEEHAPAELGEVIETLRPDRIGHGILAAREPELMTALSEAEIVLEICPTSNLLTRALPDEDAVRETFRAFVDHGVPFTIATDGPEMMRTHLRDELDLLQRIGALDEDELAEANRRGHEASFIAPVGHRVAVAPTQRAPQGRRDRARLAPDRHRLAPRFAYQQHGGVAGEPARRLRRDRRAFGELAVSFTFSRERRVVDVDDDLVPFPARTSHAGGQESQFGRGGERLGIRRPRFRGTALHVAATLPHCLAPASSASRNTAPS